MNPRRLGLRVTGSAVAITMLLGIAACVAPEMSTMRANPPNGFSSTEAIPTALRHPSFFNRNYY